MVKRLVWVFFLGVVLVTAVFAWQLPTILRTIPSRYVARLPLPIQQLGIREHAPLLPTAAVSVDVVMVLPTAVSPTLPPPVLKISAEQIAATPIPVPTATSTPTATPFPLPTAVRLEGFRHQFQTWNNCGPATLAMSLSYFGLALTQEQTASILKPNPEDRNVSPHDMATYVNQETPYAAIYRPNGSLETLRRFIASGFPVIIEVGIEPPGEYRWMGWYGHYLLIVAYDDIQQQIWVYDSWFGTSDVPMENADPNGRILSYPDADRQWQQFDRNYIVLYRPEQAEEVANIIGADMDDTTMWRNALTTVQAELSQEPDNAFLWFNLGTVYNALGGFEQAAASFDKARAIGLPWRMLWYQFGPYEAYYRIGRYADVILLTDVTLQDRPYFEESFYYRGLAQAASGDLVAAHDSLESAVVFNPNFSPAVEALEQLDR